MFHRDEAWRAPGMTLAALCTAAIPSRDRDDERDDHAVAKVVALPDRPHSRRAIAQVEGRAA